jgi:uncharacterized protein (TIGR03435 family)
VREDFEVASIKPKVFRPGRVGIQFLPGGLVRGSQAPIRMIISAAYGISLKQLDLNRVDKSLQEEVYDFEAKAGANALPANASAQARNQQLRRMLQTLLADRFKLVLHKEQREMPVYLLVVAPTGLKFQPSLSEPKCPEGRPCGVLSAGPASGLKGVNVDMGELVEKLEFFADRQILDRTGIKGHFDVELPPWNRSIIQPVDDGHEPVEDPSAPSIFTVLQKHSAYDCSRVAVRWTFMSSTTSSIPLQIDCQAEALQAPA